MCSFGLSSRVGQAYFTALGPTFQQIYDPRWLLLYSHGNTPESLGIDVVLICSLKEPLKNLRRQRKRPQRHQRNLGWHVGVGVVMLLWSSQAQWLETDVQMTDVLARAFLCGL